MALGRETLSKCKIVSVKNSPQQVSWPCYLRESQSLGPGSNWLPGLTTTPVVPMEVTAATLGKGTNKEIQRPLLWAPDVRFRLKQKARVPIKVRPTLLPLVDKSEPCGMASGWQ